MQILDVRWIRQISNNCETIGLLLQTTWFMYTWVDLMLDRVQLENDNEQLVDIENKDHVTMKIDEYAT